MEEQILKEIKELKSIIATLVGSADLPKKDQFSKETLEKSAKQFKKLSAERGEWVKDGDLSKYFKGAPYHMGRVIRNELSFTHYFKQGYEYYYNKKDLLDLKRELVKRNVDLPTFVRYIEEQAKFKKLIETANAKMKGKGKSRRFVLPDDLTDIPECSPAKLPPIDVVKEHIQNLKEQFKRDNLSEYIDIHKDRFAMRKDMSYYDRYHPTGLTNMCRKWCDDFNHANDTLYKIKQSQKSGTNDR